MLALNAVKHASADVLGFEYVGPQHLVRIGEQRSPEADWTWRFTGLK
jgi:hypothetical protein